MSSRLRLCLPHFVMLLVSVALYAAAARIDSPPGRVGPDFWPKAVIVLMGLLCLYEIVKRLVVGTEFTARGLTEGLAQNPAGDEPAAVAPDEDRVLWPVLLGGATAILAYVALVSWLGFFLSTLLFLVGFSWVGGFRRPAWVLGISLGGSLLTLVLFMRVAYISLPLGEGPFRLFSLAMLRLIGVS
jgi:hypothetical protein